MFNFCGSFSLHYATVREVFWEKLSRLIWPKRSIQRPLLFWVHVISFHSLPSRVGCSFQGKLFSISKLLCLVFVIYYLSSHTALENCVLYVRSLRSSWENFHGDTRFVLLTQAINLSRLGSCSVWIAREKYSLSQAPPSLPKLVSVIGLYFYFVNRIHALVSCSHFEQLWMQSNCWGYMYWSFLLTTRQYVY